MSSIFHIGIIVLIVLLIFFLFCVNENFSGKTKNDIVDNIGNKAFFEIKPIDPIDSLWDKKIDYCLNRGGKIEDIDFDETLLSYKPKVVLY